MPNIKRRPTLDLTTYSDMRCPMHGLLNLLSGPWTTYILWLLRLNGELRFGELKKQMPGISAKVLTERLRMLEEAGILNREQEMTIPPKVTYSFTDQGHALEKLLDEVNALALQWNGGLGLPNNCRLDEKIK
ncbi:MAG: winged helix-turn-helix transcriptional regulator [Alphaproteobacteria bacterium]